MHLTNAERAVVAALERSGPRVDVGANTAGGGGGLPSAEAASLLDVGWAPLRRSVRQFAQTDASVLTLVLRATLARQESGRQPAPTSGGIDHLRWLLVLTGLRDMGDGAFYCTADQTTVRLSTADLIAAVVLREDVRTRIGSAITPPIILSVFSDTQQVNRQYSGCTLASALWDAGAALGQAHILLSSQSVGSCIVSSSMTSRLEGVLDPSFDACVHVGSIAAGAAA